MYIEAVAKLVTLLRCVILEKHLVTNNNLHRDSTVADYSNNLNIQTFNKLDM